jgi:DNA-binding beta-propeller fold protein YncE
MSTKAIAGFLVAGAWVLATHSAASIAASTPEYRVTHTVALGAPDRWDYVVFDPSSSRVFVAHGDEVTVVDGHKGDVVGHIKGFPGGTHGVAIVSAVGRGYTDDGQAGEAGAFDLSTFKVSQHIKAAEDADAVAFDTVSGHVFVINGDHGTITVIDPKADRAVGTINAGGKLEYAVADGNGHLYVNGAGKKEVLSIDTRTNQVLARWPVPQCTSPHGLAIDASSRRLFVSCVNNLLTVVNADSGAVVSQLPIGSGTDAAAFDPKRKLIFSSNGRDGTVSVIQERDPQTFVSLGTVKTGVSGRTMGIDPDTGRLYIAVADLEAEPADAAAQAKGHRPKVVPGSLRLLFLDPAH